MMMKIDFTVKKTEEETQTSSLISIDHQASIIIAGNLYIFEKTELYVNLQVFQKEIAMKSVVLILDVFHRPRVGVS